MKILITLSLIACISLLSINTTLAQEERVSESIAVASLRAIHDITADFVLATAEMLDEDMYAYRPTVQVRTTGQQLAHIASAQFGICSTAAGLEKPADSDYDKIATTRNVILAAVKASFEYCERVYDNMTDERLKEVKPFFGGERRRDMTVAAILSFNSTHTPMNIMAT